VPLVIRRRSWGPGVAPFEQVAFGSRPISELAFGGDGLDAFVVGDNILIAGHQSHGMELQPFGQVHGGQGGLPPKRMVEGRRRS